MSNLIQWPRAKYWDAPWNPIVGCKHVSPACDNCYARTAMVERFGQSFEPHPSKKQNPPKKGVVFAGNMTDLFGEWLMDEDSIGFLSKACECTEATYLWLTKRVRDMVFALKCGWVNPKDYHPGEDILPEQMKNHYFGFTAENQEWYDRRLAMFELLDSVYNGWLSAEPLLGPIDLGFQRMETVPFRWVVVGCESGPHRRPCKVEWVESIVEQCMNAKIPVFVKQLDLNGRCETDIDRFPAHLRIRQVPWAKKGEE